MLGHDAAVWHCSTATALADPAAWLLAAFGAGVGQNTVALGVLLAALVLAVGALRFSRRRQPVAVAPLSTPPPSRRVPEGQRLAARLGAAFSAWLTDCENEPDLWTSFDELVRELVAEHLGATRVRCYHVRPGCETLQTMAQSKSPATPTGPSVRVGVLGHVAATGKEFFATDQSHGALLDVLAVSAEESWAWVWPIRESGTTVGILAVGNLHEPHSLSADTRQTVGQLVALFWRYVSCLEQLRIVRRTDQASGVLTRNDFFTLAAHCLSGSYRENEPVIVIVLAVEGLRRLDDTGRWRERDTLVERVGHLVARRIRSDDVVGRFADDRFVMLLRRLDSGLGRLIAEKMLATADECIAGLGPLKEQVRLRIGVAGSGCARPSLEGLLVSAFNAVDRARKTNVPIATDLPERKTEGVAS